MNKFLPEGWDVKTSTEYCLKVTDGTHDTPKPADDGYPLITSKNLKNGGIDLLGSYLISEDDFHDVNKEA